MTETENNFMESLYAERKNERRERVRAQLEAQLQRIEENAKSKNLEDICPFPPAAIDMLSCRRHLLANIFENLETIEDANNVSMACPLFQDVIGPKRTSLMLPEVWNILANKGYLEIPNFVCAALREILKLRFVCRSWKKAVDKEMLENSPCSNLERRFCYFTKVPDLFDCNLDLSTRLRRVLTNVNDIKRIMDKKLLPKDSPFLRIVAIWPEEALFEDSKTEEKRNFYEQAESFLEEYGSSVWYFTYGGNESRIVDEYETLHSFMEHLPNLKWLLVSLRKAQLGGCLNELKKKMKVKPFFTIPTLEFLKGEFVPPAITNEIIRANGSIKCVDIGRQDERPHLPHSMALERVCLDGNAEPAVLRSVLEPGRGQWPLTRISLLIDHDFGSINMVNAPEIFQLAEMFKDTLVEFHAENVRLVQRQTPQLPLDLPHLKNLTLSLTAEMDHIDFLLPLKSLEMLTICIWGPSQDRFVERNPNEKIQLKGFIVQGDMHNSNIWKVFPLLKFLDTRGSPYTFAFSHKRLKFYERDTTRH